MPTTFEVLFLGNFADIDPAEGNFTAENAGSLVGQTFGSLADPLAFGSQRVMSALSFSGGFFGTYDMNNALSSDLFSIDSGPAQVFDAISLYGATLTYVDGTTASISAILFQDASGNVYLAPEVTPNADQAALTAAPIASLAIDSLITSTGLSGLTADRQDTDFVCFGRGTRILTPNGELPIQDLKKGDLVTTRANGDQPVRWIGQRRLSRADLNANPSLRPVRLLAGSLGKNLPRRDLLVSRQHRLLIRSPIVERMFGCSEVLVAAHRLVTVPGIFTDQETRSVEYLHLLFEQHEVIFAEGAPAESLFAGPEAMAALSKEALLELLAVFPELFETRLLPTPAHEIPSGRKQRNLVKRHLKNGRPLVTQ